MTVVQAKPSPEGVPGAVSSVESLSAEDPAFRGAGGEELNGYLARPTASAGTRGALPRMIVTNEAMRHPRAR